MVNKSSVSVAVEMPTEIVVARVVKPMKHRAPSPLKRDWEKVVVVDVCVYLKNKCLWLTQSVMVDADNSAVLTDNHSDMDNMILVDSEAETEVRER